MNVFTVIGIVGISMVIMTALMAFVFFRLDNAVVQNNADIAAQKDRYKPNLTMGFDISQNEDEKARFRDARQEAAKRAASVCSAAWPS